ncbi:hypothetical protein [Streptomyces sp. yr375]|uniref:hypothetical protein n=1 Tax=Streptomyces sp. yr375 TaxID=1761906 RepID=UPI000B82A268|nr:hypothetical protein [Streptomyces sp. yr375]
MSWVARSRADGAEAAKTVADAVDAGGHAYTATQATEDPGASAQQVAVPADDAIQLGSPYGDGR